MAFTQTRLLALVPLAAALMLSLAGCGSSTEPGTAESSPTDGEVVRMWIEPELAECTGVGPMECMQVSYTEDGTPELFYSAIDGFEFSEGTAYVLDVKVTQVASPPADGSSLAYSLVEVVSQTPTP